MLLRRARTPNRPKHDARILERRWKNKEWPNEKSSLDAVAHKKMSHFEFATALRALATRTLAATPLRFGLTNILGAEP